MPGNAGSSAGWLLTKRPAKRSRNTGPTSRMKPADTTRSGDSAATRSASATSHPARSACPAGAQTNVSTDAARARSRAPAPARSDPTATTVTPYAGSATASSSACRVEPLPEASTTTRGPGPKCTRPTLAAAQHEQRGGHHGGPLEPGEHRDQPPAGTGFAQPAGAGRTGGEQAEHGDRSREKAARDS